MPEGKPSLCIINYNGAAILSGALSAACAVADRFSEIFVVDNGSQDASLQLIERDFPSVRILRLTENLGAGGARNAGLKQAPTDLIVFIDNDVALTGSCVDQLMAAMVSNPRAVLAAPAVIYAHRRDTIQYDGAQCHFLGLQTLLDEDVPVTSVAPGPRKVGSMVSCCFIVDRQRMPGLELFDEAFFIYFEDHDFGVRLRALGGELLSVPGAHCYHGKGTEGLSIRALGTYSTRRVFLLIRNRWLFLLKNYQLRTLIVLTPLFMFYECAQFAVILKKGWLREWGRAWFWVVRHLGSVLRERRRIQRLRKVPDRELLVGGSIPFRSELTTSKIEFVARCLLNAVASTYWKLAAAII